LFDYGVGIIGAATVTNIAQAQTLVSHGAQLPFGQSVEMIRFYAPVRKST
jgi:2-keto-3-deoxy-6-phosphogluconate aldolase